jgi:hypothetical protein
MAFSASDLIKIIKQCGNSGVKSFKVADLELSFLDTEQESSQNLPSPEKIENPMLPGEKEDPAFTTLTDEEREDALLISDPGKWEREIIAKESEETFYIGTSPTL